MCAFFGGVGRAARGKGIVAPSGRLGAKAFLPSFRRRPIFEGRIFVARVPALRAEDVDVFAPRRSRERIRMECGTKITPCGGTPLGVASQKEHALERRNSPAGTPNASGGCAFQARRIAGCSPSARFAARMGLRLFRPVGVDMAFPSADFEGKRDACPPVKVFSFSSVPCRFKICAGRFRKRQECRFPSKRTSFYFRDFQ